MSSHSRMTQLMQDILRPDDNGDFSVHHLGVSMQGWVDFNNHTLTLQHWQVIGKRRTGISRRALTILRHAFVYINVEWRPDSDTNTPAAQAFWKTMIAENLVDALIDTNRPL